MYIIIAGIHVGAHFFSFRVMCRKNISMKVPLYILLCKYNDVKKKKPKNIAEQTSRRRHYVIEFLLLLLSIPTYKRQFMRICVRMWV